MLGRSWTSVAPLCLMRYSVQAHGQGSTLSVAHSNVDGGDQKERPEQVLQLPTAVFAYEVDCAAAHARYHGRVSCFPRLGSGARWR